MASIEELKAKKKRVEDRLRQARTSAKLGQIAGPNQETRLAEKRAEELEKKLDNIRNEIKKKSGWGMVEETGRKIFEKGKDVFGQAKRAPGHIKESYDWEKEKRQAKWIKSAIIPGGEKTERAVITTLKYIGLGLFIIFLGFVLAGKLGITGQILWIISMILITYYVLSTTRSLISTFIIDIIASIILYFLIGFALRMLGLGVEKGAIPLAGVIKANLPTVFLAFLFLFEIYILFSVSKKSGGNPLVIILLILILGGIDFFGYSFYLTLPGETPADKFATLTTKIRDVLWTPFTMIKEYQKKYEAALTGDYFTGQVDKNKHEPIGVYLENIKASDPYFYSDEPIIIWGTLNAKVLDEAVNVSLSCDIKGDKGIITPDFLANKFSIESYEEEDFECTLPAQPKEALHIARVYADFNFKTMAYVKGYFIDKTRMRTMTREGIDILGQYGITDKNPAAVYSNGPVGIGMQIETGKQPIGIYTEKDSRKLNEISLGVTLDNRWEGAIEKITDLIIKVPEGLTIENLDCGRGYVFENLGCAGGGKLTEYCEAGYNLYKLKNPKIPKDPNFETFKCDFGVDQDLELLGTTPISTRYFKVVAEYDYKLNKSTTMTVKKSKTAIPSKAELIQKIISEAKIKNVPVDLALALAEQESGITHLKSDGSIVESSAGALGVMQVMPATGKTRCGIGISNIYNADKNIECGLTILKSNYDNYKNGIDKENIRKSCTNEKYIKKYADYRLWDAALRVYNGLGCPANAVNFVEQVNDKKSKYASYT